MSTCICMFAQILLYIHSHIYIYIYVHIYALLRMRGYVLQCTCIYMHKRMFMPVLTVQDKLVQSLFTVSCLTLKCVTNS